MSEISIRGRILAYEAQPATFDSSAVTIVFVHGSGGDRDDWRGQLDGMADSVNTVAVELPGHGRSEPPGETSVDAYAQWVADLIEALGLRQVMLVGNSLGGAIALRLAVDPPGWLKAIGIVGSGARLKVMPAVLEGLKTEPAKTLDMFSDFTVSSSASEDVRNAVVEKFRKGSAVIIHGDLSACNDFDIMDRLREITVPTWIIVGEDDRLTPVKYAEFLHEKIAGSTLVKVPGAGHLVMAEKARDFNRHLLNFIGGLAR
jgi:pimeloyl-ACP methyl ester carboxylesterase